ncbi:hypothetical protein [Phenylobacterium sp.]|jgi:hypothetical protein|uniref:hypothetical protein n=1 Tax=Phenylobacterium sp. TaxID=1871053 RepID=UPI002F3E5609
MRTVEIVDVFTPGRAYGYANRALEVGVLPKPGDSLRLLDPGRRWAAPLSRLLVKTVVKMDDESDGYLVFFDDLSLRSDEEAAEFFVKLEADGFEVFPNSEVEADL